MTPEALARVLAEYFRVREDSVMDGPMGRVLIPQLLAALTPGPIGDESIPSGTASGASSVGIGGAGHITPTPAQGEHRCEWRETAETLQAAIDEAEPRLQAEHLAVLAAIPFVNRCRQWWDGTDLYIPRSGLHAEQQDTGDLLRAAALALDATRLVVPTRKTPPTEPEGICDHCGYKKGQHPFRIDPIGCGCTDCLTGCSIPMDEVHAALACARGK